MAAAARDPFDERKPFSARLETPRFMVRTVTPADAHARWCAWLDDPEAAAMLNAPRRVLSLTQLQSYIGRHDQVRRLIVGLYDRSSGVQIGFATGEFSQDGRYVMPSILIGEPAFRHIGAITEILATLRNFFFENLAFEAVIAHVLPHNAPVIALLTARGWTFLERLPNEKKRADGDGHYDMLVYAFTRETWERQAKAR